MWCCLDEVSVAGLEEGGGIVSTEKGSDLRTRKGGRLIRGETGVLVFSG